MTRKQSKDRIDGKSEAERTHQDKTFTGLSFIDLENQIHRVTFDGFVDQGTDVRVWRIGSVDDSKITIVTNQQKGHKDRGMVVASIEYEQIGKKYNGKVSFETRPLTKDEHDFITDEALYELEPHDYDTIAKDVFVTEEVVS